MYRHRTFYYFSSSRFLTYMTLGCAPRSPTRLLKLHQRTTSDNRRAGSSYWNLGSRCADEGHKFSTTTNSHRHLHILFFTATRLHVFFSLSSLSLSITYRQRTNHGRTAWPLSTSSHLYQHLCTIPKNSHMPHNFFTYYYYYYHLHHF